MVIGEAAQLRAVEPGPGFSRARGPSGRRVQLGVKAVRAAVVVARAGGLSRAPAAVLSRQLCSSARQRRACVGRLPGS